MMNFDDIADAATCGVLLCQKNDFTDRTVQASSICLNTTHDWCHV